MVCPAIAQSPTLIPIYVAVGVEKLMDTQKKSSVAFLATSFGLGFVATPESQWWWKTTDSSNDKGLLKNRTRLISSKVRDGNGEREALNTWYLATAD